MTDQNLKTAHYLSTLIGFAKSKGASPSEVARWSIEQAENTGYYFVANIVSESEFVNDFVSGRMSLYNDVKVQEFESHYEIRSLIWYKLKPPQAFQFFDLTSDDLCEYGRTLALLNAEKLGVDLRIENIGGYEHATVGKQK